LYSYEIERVVDSPAKVVWEVISNLDEYHQYAPNLSRSEVLSGEGVGLRRRCHDTKGRGWDEQCVLWREGEIYSMEVDPEGYPYPFSKMQGTWGLEERSNGTLIKMRFDYLPKPNLPIIGPLMDKLAVKPAMAKISKELMDNWEAQIVKRANV